MAKICDSCFTTDTGFVVEASYPYDTTYSTPDRLYCIDGVPTAPPSTGAVSSLGSSWEGDPLAGPTSGTLLVFKGSAISWTNLTGRMATLVLAADALIVATANTISNYIDIVYNVSVSDSSSSPTIRMALGILTANTLGANGAADVVSASGNTGGFAVAPGVSVTVSPTGAFYTSGTSSSTVVAEISTSAFLIGAV